MASEADSVGPLIRPQMMRAARVKSQIATVSRWSDASATKHGAEEEIGGTSWSRAQSMASNGSRSSRGTSSSRSSRRGRSTSPSSGGRAPAVPSLAAGSTIDLRETLQSPSRGSEAPHEPRRAKRASTDDQKGIDDSQEEETVIGGSRDSTASGVSSTSTVRRFRKIVNQLDFGDVSRWVRPYSRLFTEPDADGLLRFSAPQRLGTRRGRSSSGRVARAADRRERLQWSRPRLLEAVWGLPCDERACTLNRSYTSVVRITDNLDERGTSARHSIPACLPARLRPCSREFVTELQSRARTSFLGPLRAQRRSSRGRGEREEDQRACELGRVRLSPIGQTTTTATTRLVSHAVLLLLLLLLLLAQLLLLFLRLQPGLTLQPPRSLPQNLLQSSRTPSSPSTHLQHST